MTITSISFGLPKESKTNLNLAKEDSASKKKIDQIAEQIIKKGKKRGFEDPIEIHSEKLETSDLGSKKLKKDESPLIEMSFHDAHVLGSYENRSRKIQGIKEKGIKNLSDCSFVFSEASKLDPPLVRLNKQQKTLFEDISKTRSEKSANQFELLLEILNAAHYAHKPEGKKLIDFAIQIIHTIPKKEVIEDSDSESEKKDESESKEFQSLLSIIQSVKEASENEELVKGDQEELSDIEGIDSVDEYPEVTKALGELLLVADQGIIGAAQLLSETSLERNREKITAEAAKLIKQASQNVVQHEMAHQNAAIQDAKEAMLVRMSVEMSKLLILSTGKFNVGIHEQISDLLPPEKFKELLSIQDILNILSVISQASEITNSIANMNPPATKNISSDLAIRVLLGIPYLELITKRDAQIFVVSALLSHIRQAMAGTCFATCFLIKAWNEQLDLVVKDLIECTEFGEVSRTSRNHIEKFPFQTNITSEYLDTLITADRTGRVRETERYTIRVNSLNEWPKVGDNSYLYDAPGIKAVALAMNIEDTRSAVISALQNLPNQFSISQLIEELANIACKLQDNHLMSLRSLPIFSKDQLITKGLYAFGSQTNNPLLRGYEQTTTIMVDYFSEPEVMPQWIYSTMKETLEKKASGQSLEFQSMYRTLLKKCCSPMIMRMKYLYNHNFKDNKVLFNDGNHGIFEHHMYGYELWDMGLPKDFVYSDDLQDELNKGSSSITLYRFNQYAPKHKWNLVDSPEKFQTFIQDVINETAIHLSKSVPAPKRKLVQQVAEKMSDEVGKSLFIKQMVFEIFGRDSEQEKEWSKNKFSMQSTPWKFRWGGDFRAVLRTFYGFQKNPGKMKKFNGTQKEVLAKCINYIKNQPGSILEDIKELYARIVITSPVHAFLLTPGEDSFSQAWQSELSPNEYIEQNVLEPGLQVANRRTTLRMQNEIIEFVATNQWYHRCYEDHDFERLQLTEQSQKVFDELIDDSIGLKELTSKEFEKEVCRIVFKSRAADDNIKEHNKTWEGKYSRIFHNKMKSLISEDDMNKSIPRDIVETMLDFARNHRDTNKFSPEASAKFRELMSEAPTGLNIHEFREIVVKNAYKVHVEERGMIHKKWKEDLCPFLDSKLFALLPKKARECIINSGIVTHDSNWKVSVYNCHLMFTINPGSGQLELCKYLPDLNELTFMDQPDWFPEKERGKWQFPDNYRVYKDEPLFKHSYI